MIGLAKLSVAVVAVLFFMWILLQFVDIYVPKAFKTGTAIVFCVCMMLIAYSSWLGDGADLARYYAMLDTMQGKSFAWASKYGWYNESLVTNTVMWIVAQTGNHRLLPSISTGFVLLNLFALMRMQTVRFGIRTSTQLAYLVAYIAVATFAAIMTGVRNEWMLSVYALALCRDVVQEKRNLSTVFLYIIACFIHSSALLLVAIRVAALVKGRGKYLFLGWSLLIPTAEKLLPLGGVVSEAFGKANRYMSIQDLDIRYLIARTGVLFLLLFALRRMKKRKLVSPYLAYMEMLFIFTIGSAGIQHLYSRLINAIVIQSLPLLSETKRSMRSDEWKLFLLVLFVLSMGLIAYHMTTARIYWRFI